MIPALIEAAKLARLHSTTLDRRQVVEVLITELGLVVRGTYQDALTAYSAECDCDWPQLEADPTLAVLTVGSVIGSLDARAKQLGQRPVREGA
jgi:hypothetical protein